MKLNEKQLYELRLDLLRMSGGNVQAAREAYLFLMEPAPDPKIQVATTTTTVDGAVV